MKALRSYNANEVDRHHVLRELLVFLSTLAFFLYTAGVLALHQDRTFDWGNETAAAVPAAVSHLIYGTPIGAMDSNVRGTFWRIKAEISIDEAIRKVADGSIPKGVLEPWGADGLGAGTTLFATFSMWLFGMYMSSFVYFFLGVVGISTMAFILRFRDARLFSVPLYFFVLSVMLLTPLCASPDIASGVPIGGNRYFSLAAILPTLHIWFEVLEHTPSRSRLVRYSLLFVQATVLFGVLLVRSSAALLLVLLATTIIWQLVQKQSVTRMLISAACIAAAGLLWAYIVVTTMPTYVESGRVFGNVWHRAFASFYFHPSWPFGNLTETYDCAWALPQGLRADPDASAKCVWFAEPAVQKLPHVPLVLSLYGREYEAVLRKAFLKVASSYPKETLELFVLIKGTMVWNTIATALQDLLEVYASAAPKSVFWIVIAQGAVFAVFVAAVLLNSSLIGWWAVIFPILFLLSLVPLHVAWSFRTTSSDTVFLFYSNLILFAIVAFQMALLQIRGIYARKTRLAYPAQ